MGMSLPYDLKSDSCHFRWTTSRDNRRLVGPYSEWFTAGLRP